jgi:hypothetical protein
MRKEKKKAHHPFLITYLENYQLNWLLQDNLSNKSKMHLSLNKLKRTQVIQNVFSDSNRIKFEIHKVTSPQNFLLSAKNLLQNNVR